MGCSRRRSSALTAILAATLLAVMVAPGAGAAGFTAFQTPSKAISCAFLGGSQPTLRCDIARMANTPKPRPSWCEYDYGAYFGLTPRGHAKRLCVSDTVADPDARVVRYGRSIERHGMRCTSRRTGLRCVNERQHGFRISRSSQKSF
jgi:hypothetical protein